MSQVTSRAQLESASCLAPGFPPLLTENTSAPLATAALHRADPTKPDPPTTTTLAALDAAAEHNARPTMFVFLWRFFRLSFWMIEDLWGRFSNSQVFHGKVEFDQPLIFKRAGRGRGGVH